MNNTYFFIGISIFFFPTTSFSMMRALKAGCQSFKISLQHDMRKHIRTIEEKTVKKIVKNDALLKFAQLKETELKKALKKEQSNIKKYQCMRIIHQQILACTHSLASFCFDKDIKSLSPGHLLSDGKDTKKDSF